MTGRSTKRGNVGPFSPPPSPPPAKETLAKTPEASNIVPDVEMSPTGNLDFSPKPYFDHEPPATLQKRIPEDVAEFFFGPNDATPAKPIPPAIIYEKKAGVYSEAYRTPLLLATTISL